MASAPTLPLVPVDEYLNSSYHPDMEYVDGVLEERSVPTYFHALLQVILISHFRQFEKQGSFKVLPEVRTQIVARARYRIPDLLLCATPTAMQRVMTEAPLVVIEMLSPDDRISQTLKRFGDYAGIGVHYIIQMDPEEYVAHQFEGGSLIRRQFDGLRFDSRIIPFNSEELFEQLRRELAEAAEPDQSR